MKNPIVLALAAISLVVAIGRFTVPGHGLSYPGSYEALAHIWVGLLIGAAILAPALRWPALGFLGGITALETVAFALRASIVGLCLALLLLAPGAASAATPLPKPKPAAASVAVHAAPATGTVTQAQALQNPLLVVQQFSVADLQAALADAQAQTPPDTTSAACYTALIPLVQSTVTNPLPQGLGIFQALQKVRDLKAFMANLQSPTGPLAALNIACAPLAMATENTVVQLGIMGGVVAATGGAAGVLPALGPLTLPFALPISIPGL